MFRKNKIEIEYNENIPNEIYSNHVNEQSESEERLFEGIRRLNMAERAIIALFLEDFTYKEIGEITGITENYVGVKINRIKEKLKNILK